MEQAIPSKLYKYQSYNKQTLNNLRDRRIWYSKPRKFNDPYDPAPPLPAGPSGNDWQAMYDYLKKSGSPINDKKMAKKLNDEMRDKKFLTNGKPNEDFRALFKEPLSLYYKLGKKLGKMNLGSMGISCFSKTNENILMWAHYANGHRGFCLEFDTKYAPFQNEPLSLHRNAKEVVYSPFYPSINFIDIVTDISKWEEALLFTKSNHWGYEEEWRITYFKGNTGFTYQESSLTGIYFGCAMSSIHKNAIASILADTPTIPYEMQRSETEYKIKPQLFKQESR